MNDNNAISHQSNESKRIHKSASWKNKLALGLATALTLGANDVDAQQTLPNYDGKIGISKEEKFSIDSLTNDDIRTYRFDPNLSNYLRQSEQELGAAMVLDQIDQKTDTDSGQKIFELYASLMDQLAGGHKNVQSLKDALLTPENIEGLMQRRSNFVVNVDDPEARRKSFEDMFFLLGWYTYEIAYKGGAYDGKGEPMNKGDLDVYDLAMKVIDHTESGNIDTENNRLNQIIVEGKDPEAVFQLMKELINQKSSLKFYFKKSLDVLLSAIETKDIDKIYKATIGLATAIHRSGDIDTILSENDRLYLMQQLRGTLKFFVAADATSTAATVAVAAGHRAYIENILRDLQYKSNGLGDEFDKGEMDGVDHADVEGKIQDADFSGDVSYLTEAGALRSLESKHRSIVSHIEKFESDTINLSGLHSVDQKLFADVVDKIRDNDNIKTVILNPSLILTYAQTQSVETAPQKMRDYLKEVSSLFNGERHIVIRGPFNGLGVDYKDTTTIDGKIVPARNGSENTYIGRLLSNARRTGKSMITYYADGFLSRSSDALARYKGTLRMPYMSQWTLGLEDTKEFFDTWGKTHTTDGKIELGLIDISNEHIRAMITSLKNQGVTGAEMYLPRMQPTHEIERIAKIADKIISFKFGESLDAKHKTPTQVHDQSSPGAHSLQK